jgi:flavonol-3-O-glucoside L-rhamnosyltransferase
VYTSFDGNPSVYDRLVACIEASDCIVIKSCAEMEGHYINYLSEQFGKPMFVAGPVVPEPPQGVLEERWATWLSSFPDNTVTFATFGSETFLPVSAATELLLGLEATGRPFLAVLNFPKGVDAEAELKARVLPGFEERVRGRGVVHTGWMPQQHIPRHRSVWCFLNHARRVQLRGGGSRGGVPAGASADEGRPFPQRGSLRARAQGRRDEDGWFGRDDVARAVAAATADGGDGDGGKWSEFLMDLKEMVHSA